MEEIDGPIETPPRPQPALPWRVKKEEAEQQVEPRPVGMTWLSGDHQSENKMENPDWKDRSRDNDSSLDETWETNSEDTAGEAEDMDL